MVEVTKVTFKIMIKVAFANQVIHAYIYTQCSVLTSTV